MSKKDYQAFAEMVYRIRQRNPAFSQSVDAHTSSDLVVEGMIEVFRRDNPRFESGRFREARENGKTKGMKQVMA